jgi:hypothetical protein
MKLWYHQLVQTIALPAVKCICSDSLATPPRDQVHSDRFHLLDLGQGAVERCLSDGYSDIDTSSRWTDLLSNKPASNPVSDRQYEWGS